MMYEIMNTKADKVSTMGGKDITFDFEGKIIQIKKPTENSFPETVSGPKIRLK